MAPEVANCEPYDQRCDAYSFGILFWQICSLTTPFAGFSLNMHAERVVRLGHRPKPDSTWPTSWVNVMMECWSTDVTARPSMEVVMSILAQEVVEMEQDEGMMLPTRASEKIRAKQRKRKKLQRPNQLDVDTRLATTTGAADAVPLASLSAVVEDDGGIAKRFDNHIV
jgi:serine/threonine protein kinase